LDEQTRASLLNHIQQSGEELGKQLDFEFEFSNIRNALILAWNLCGQDVEIIKDYVAAPTELEFKGLKWLLRNFLEYHTGL
jgi:hypothetical protein